MTFFRAYKTDLKIPTFFIESTAPDNVDDTEEQSIGQELDAIKEPELRTLLDKANFKSIDADVAVEKIAEILAKGQKPNLVVMVHGFNNPELDVLRMYAMAAEAIHNDSAIAGGDGLVCVGYRWPSERMFTPIWSSWSALPVLPLWLLLSGLAVLAFSILLFGSLPLFYVALPPVGIASILTHGLHYIIACVAHIAFLIGWIVIGLVLMTVLLRAIVYFRDNYRATNYGVPDLVQIIRAIEGRLINHHGMVGGIKIDLSFIGHSMGGLVVTNAIRMLSDIKPVDALSQYGAAAPKPGEEKQKIGQNFVLRRFVLASPDIPAETLLSDRGNFLASVLSRFDEAFLFSNEGDEVLRLISTLANYFVFPSKSANHGFRLGNAEILSCGYGIIDYHKLGNDFLAMIRVGNLTLQQLYNRLGGAAASRHKDLGPTTRQTHLPKVFTYFDCTDYFDEDSSGSQPRGLLTNSLCNKRTNAAAFLPFRVHLGLLFDYVKDRRPNVHGGYFEGKLSQQLIYRLACLGYEGTRDAYNGEHQLGAICEQKRIRVLLSPALNKHGGGPAAAKLHGT
jgi:hypothetical protein